MASFLSASQTSKIETMFDCLHETFSQKINVYKDAKRTLIASNPKYNSVYGRTQTGKDDSVQYTLQPKVFDARVYYIKTEEELLNNYKTQTKTIIPKGNVKVIVRKDGFDYLQESRRVEFDGRMFTIKTDGSPYGLTGNLFYTFYLDPLDEAKE